MSDDNLQKRTFDDDDGPVLHDDHVDDMQDENTHKIEEEEPVADDKIESREKRDVPHKRIRRSKKFCDGGGVFCALYRAIQGEPISSQLIAERREETVNPSLPRYEGPPTPW